MMEWFTTLVKAADELGFDVVRVEAQSIELSPRNNRSMTVTVEGVILSGHVLRELFGRKGPSDA